MKTLIKRITKRHSKVSNPQPLRITADTVAEHRENVLSGGRKFKYPIQYTKHKLVINTIIIIVTTLIAMSFTGWLVLYPMQNTSDFMYRVTKIVPVPVASVDGQFVLYSDYLMAYRNSLYFSQNYQQLNPKTEDGKRQIAYLKQQSLREVIADSYAYKLSMKNGITVTSKEVDNFIKGQRQLGSGEISQQTYDASVKSLFNWTPEENRYYLTKGILRRKVAYAIDKKSQKITKAAEAILKSNSTISIKDLSAQLSAIDKTVKITTGNSGWVPVNNWDGGLSKIASKLKPNEMSAVLNSTKGDGYYFIKLISTNNNKVNYEYVQVPLTDFDKALAKLYKDHKVQKYITVD